MSKEILFEKMNNELNIVYRYLLSKGVPHTDAEDAVQEAAYRYLRYVDSIKSPNVRNWLIRVSINYYYDQCRKNKKYIFNFDEKINEEESSDLPEMILLAKERIDEFNKLLLRLKPLYAELLLLKYQSNLSYAEISKVLGMSNSTIKNNLFRARKKFMKLYEEAYYEKGK
ncbi:RNA polymerase subunit sigma-70 [Virgibacillus indicus]|uniref:RNA polymerase subunit sigma-70 n=1 Tax=Virgibacillus indicus TaxID=2024554 RepID=A0A265N9F3_9BACI|nr:sigma-70 family RNA polymerase sigma factor [Virgibacillus indicus]OZU88623.1 RNA polymerase subunit sigma-70 [Virgibacillus indicus]